MGSSIYTVSEDPSSSELLGWRWPGMTVAMGTAPARGAEVEVRATAFRTGWGVLLPPGQGWVSCFPSPPLSPAAVCSKEGTWSRRLMSILQSTNRFLLGLHRSPG